MGIQGFSRWLHGKFPEAYTPLYDRDAANVDHVYLDMNEHIHTACRACKTEDQALAAVVSFLWSLLRQLKPRRSVHLMVDGPAPLAKLYKQRQRRANPSRSSGIPSHLITPGTAFMRDLDQALRFFCCSYLASPDAPSGLRAVVSPYASPGEGEVKITQAVIANCRKGPTDTHVFVGGDSDGILLGMANLAPNFYVYSKGFVSMPSCLSVSRLSSCILNTLVPEAPSSMAQGTAALFRMDFIILSTLAGNDYLPKVTSAFDTTLRIFKKMQRPRHRHLVRLHKAPSQKKAHGCNVEEQDDALVCMTLDLANFLDFLSQLAPWVKDADELPAVVDRPGRFKRGPSPRPGGTKPTKAGPTDAVAEQVIASSRPGSTAQHRRSHHRDVGSPTGANNTPDAHGSSDPAPNLSNYVWGLTWLVNMYLTGQCIDYQYCCMHQTFPPHMVVALQQHLQQLQQEPCPAGGNMLQALQAQTLERVMACIKRLPENRPLAPLPFLAALLGPRQASAAPVRLRPVLREGAPLQALFAEGRVHEAVELLQKAVAQECQTLPSQWEKELKFGKDVAFVKRADKGHAARDSALPLPPPGLRARPVTDPRIQTRTLRGPVPWAPYHEVLLDADTKACDVAAASPALFQLSDVELTERLEAHKTAELHLRLREQRAKLRQLWRNLTKWNGDVGRTLQKMCAARSDMWRIKAKLGFGWWDLLSSGALNVALWTVYLSMCAVMWPFRGGAFRVFVLVVIIVQPYLWSEGAWAIRQSTQSDISATSKPWGSAEGFASGDAPLKHPEGAGNGGFGEAAPVTEPI